MANEAYARLWGKAGDHDIDALITTLPATIGRATESTTQQPGFIPIGESKNISKHHATLDWSEEDNRFELLCCSKNGMTVNGVQFNNGDVAGLTSHSAIRLGDVCVYFLLPSDTHPGSEHRHNHEAQRDRPHHQGTIKEEPFENYPDDQGGDDMSEQSSSRLPDEDSVRMKSEGDADSQPGGLQSTTDVSQKTTPSKQLTYPEMIARAFESAQLQEKATNEGLLAKEVVQWVLAEYFENDTSRRQKVQNAVSNYLCKTYEKIASHPSQTRNVRWRKPDGTLRTASLSVTHSYAQLRSVDDADSEPKAKRVKRAQFLTKETGNQYEPLAEPSPLTKINGRTTVVWSTLADQLPLTARDMMPKLHGLDRIATASEQELSH